MINKVLIIPDKFKGTLTAAEAAKAIAAGWRRARPDDKLDLLPMSDGGDGFGEVISRLLGAQQRTVATVDAAHRRRLAKWWWEPGSQTAIIESAQIIGLALLPRGAYHPIDLDTFGLGKVLQTAHETGAHRCLIGIGGSATNDGGFGVARALGWNFVDATGNLIEHWTGLGSLAKTQPPKRRRLFKDIRVAVDVQNRLLGAKGATRVYGPQKGLTASDFKKAESCLRKLAAIARKQFSRDCLSAPGSGAAGGLGFGLRCFLGARLESGFDLFARHSKLPQRLRTATLVVTGEGAIDRSTLMGKGVGEIARLCKQHGLPCIGLGGIVAKHKDLARYFDRLGAMTPNLTSPDLAHECPAYWLAELAAQIAANLGAPPA